MLLRLLLRRLQAGRTYIHNGPSTPKLRIEDFTRAQRVKLRMLRVLITEKKSDFRDLELAYFRDPEPATFRDLERA